MKCMYMYVRVHVGGLRVYVLFHVHACACGETHGHPV